MNYYRLINSENNKYFDTIEANQINRVVAYKGLVFKIVRREKHKNKVWSLHIRELPKKK